MSTKSCPDLEQLTAFVECTLAGESAQSVLEHLDHCQRCEETVVGLEGATCRITPGPTEIPYESEPECQRLVEAVIRNPVTTVSETTSDTLEEPPLELLRDYRLLEKIGQGGMGAVYKAIHTRLQKTVALKVLPSHRLGDAEAVSRFHREMAMVGRLHHPHIVQAHDAGEDQGQHYLAMEFINGVTLADLVTEHGPLKAPDACLLMTQAAMGLQYAFENGLVHRDIKPGNLMLDNRGQLRILDLGLARPSQIIAEMSDPSSEKPLTMAGQIVGTLDYMAPEQAKSFHEVDIRADIYSLGATFYKLLSGESPLSEHTKRPPLERLIAIVQEMPPDLRQRRSDLPEGLVAIVNRMLAKDAAHRFQTPAEVMAALQPYCRGADLQSLANPERAGGSASPPVNVADISSDNSHRRRARVWQVAAVIAAISLMAIAIFQVRTEHGTLLIQIEDPAVQALLEKNGLVVRDKDTNRTWTLTTGQKKPLPTGEYEIDGKPNLHLIVTDDAGVELTTDAFTLKKGSEVRIRVSLEAPNAVAASNSDGANTATRPKPMPEKTVATSVSPSPAKSLSLGDAAIPDRERPFVRLSPSGEVRDEHRFANEALAVLQGDDVLEVHGNGPFKVGQITRSNSSLHIRAGKGYRPQFVVGFEIPAEARQFQAGTVRWFTLDNVELTLTGCDFVGGISESFYQFAGSGKNWTIEDCRMIQPVMNWGAILMFQGDSITVRDSLLSIGGTGGAVANVTGVPQVRFERNVLAGSIGIGLDSGVPQSVVLQGNTIYAQNLVVVSKTANTGGPPVVEAQDNLFMCTGMCWSFGESAPHPNPKLTWKGRHNRYLPMQPGYLWSRPVAEGEAPSGFATVDEWNAHWKNPDDLKQIETVRFAWELFDETDWTAARERIGTEITAARKRFPDLAQLGPDITRVGSGAGYDQTLQAAQTEPLALRAEVPEGGPFVLFRNGQIVEGYVSSTSALEHAKDGDVIEVRSDGPFPGVELHYPYQPRLTIRAGAGYRPSFGRFNVHQASGEWTLEGLHFRGESLAVWCRARRIANCSVDAMKHDGRIQLFAPGMPEQPIEIVNCYFPNALMLSGTKKSRIENSVLAQVELQASEEVELDISHCAIWSHSSPQRRGFGTALATTNARIRCVDSLIDATTLASPLQLPWQGERNLYRIGSLHWPAFHTKETYKPFFTFADWQQHWKSDVDSREDDSVYFRKKLWTPVGLPTESR